jgi:hypothetical protein
MLFDILPRQDWRVAAAVRDHKPALPRSGEPRVIR